MEFDWDEAKDTKLRTERGFGFADAVPIFAGPIVEWEDNRVEYGEVRMKAVGVHNGRFFTVVYTERPPVRWMITAWSSHKKERALWQRSV